MKYAHEILKEINDSLALFNTKYKNDFFAQELIRYALEPAAKLQLPEGFPPLKKQHDPIGLTSTNLISQIKKFYVFQRQDISKVRKEQLFIQLLEAICREEAEVLVLIKDQQLNVKYPNITRESLGLKELPKKLELGLIDQIKIKDKHL